MPIPLRPAVRLLVAVVACALFVSAGAGPVAAQAPDPAAALLRLDDLPAGWMLDPSFDTDGDDDALPDPCRDGPPVQPRAVAATQFTRGRFGPSVAHAAVIFAPDEAARAMTYLRDTFDRCRDLAGLGDQIGVAVLALPALGDESFALRLEATSGRRVMRFDVAAARRGDALFLLALIGGRDGEHLDLDFIERLARIADERLAALVH